MYNDLTTPPLTTSTTTTSTTTTERPSALEKWGKRCGKRYSSYTPNQKVQATQSKVHLQQPHKGTGTADTHPIKRFTYSSHTKVQVQQIHTQSKGTLTAATQTFNRYMCTAATHPIQRYRYSSYTKGTGTAATQKVQIQQLHKRYTYSSYMPNQKVHLPQLYTQSKWALTAATHTIKRHIISSYTPNQKVQVQQLHA